MYLVKNQVTLEELVSVTDCLRPSYFKNLASGRLSCSNSAYFVNFSVGHQVLG
jgi:hypothetical protein